MTPDERWLAAVWPYVCAQLPAAPARVVEIGCGPLGGFVPMLRTAGYEAAGLHTGQDILRELGARFDSGPVTYGPYFFPDLAGISETEEQAAIDARLIEPGRIQYAGRQRPDRCGPPAPA